MEKNMNIEATPIRQAFTTEEVTVLDNIGTR